MKTDACSDPRFPISVCKVEVIVYTSVQPTGSLISILLRRKEGGMVVDTEE